MNKVKTVGIFFILLSFVFIGCKPEGKEVALEKDIPLVNSENGGLFLPDGFEAHVVVDSIGPTRHIAVSDKGDIYAQLNFSKDGKGTIALRDTDNDYRADSIVHFGNYKVDDAQGATGITFHDGYLYVSSRKVIYRTKMDDQLIPTAESEVVFTDMDPNVESNWHTTKPLAFDNDGNIYIPFGAPSDACQDIDKYGLVGIQGGKGLDPCPSLKDHAGIWKFPANKLGMTQEDGEKYATGLRSIVGMKWDSDYGGLYAVVNGMDNFQNLFPDRFSNWAGAELPAELLARVDEGSDFGWPYAYYDHHKGKNVLQPGYGGDGEIVGRASEFDEPVMGFPGHWAPMDVLFYKGDQLPERYKKGAFVAFHGSTARAPYSMAGFIVCFVPFNDDGTAKGDWEVFADGFTGVDQVVNTSDAEYRPMGLAEGPDGSLYISESNKGKIWRIMYGGAKDNFGEEDLANMQRIKDTRSYIRTPDEENDIIQEGDTYSGRILYEQHCAVCHLGDGKGDSNRYPSLRGSAWVIGEEDTLIDVVLNGLTGEITVDGRTFDGLMPQHRHLDDYAIANILTYVRKRFGDDSPSISSDKVAEIREKSNKAED